MPRRGAGCIESAYLFPGIGLGTLVARATRLREDMLLAAAEALAATVTDGAGLDMCCMHAPICVTTTDCRDHAAALHLIVSSLPECASNNTMSSLFAAATTAAAAPTAAAAAASCTNERVSAVQRTAREARCTRRWPPSARSRPGWRARWPRRRTRRAWRPSCPSRTTSWPPSMHSCTGARIGTTGSPACSAQARKRRYLRDGNCSRHKRSLNRMWRSIDVLLTHLLQYCTENTVPLPENAHATYITAT